MLAPISSTDGGTIGRTQVISSRGSLFAGRAMYQRISDWNSSNVRQTTCLFPFAIVSERHSICASDRAERRSVVFISIHRGVEASASEQQDKVGNACGYALCFHYRGFRAAPCATVRNGEQEFADGGVLEPEPIDALFVACAIQRVVS